MTDRKDIPREELRRTVKEANKEAHRRLAARRESINKVIEQSDRVQKRLRRAAEG